MRTKYERQGLRALFLFLGMVLAFHAGNIFAETNLFQNPEFIPDPANSAVPLGWNFSSFGANTATPIYPAPGPDASTTAVKVNMTAYTNGFADWYGAPVSVTPFAEYRYTDSYMSDATGIVEAQYTMPGGNVFTDLAYTSPTNGTWTTADVTFSIPSGATSVTIFHLINGAGSLSVAKPMLVKVSDSQVFDQGMVTLTFDDGNQTHYDYARPILNSAGLPGTFYIAGQFMHSADQIGTSTGDIDNDYMNTAEVKQMNAAGHEIGNHTLNHCNLLTGRCPDGDPPNTPDQLDYIQEIDQGKAALEAIGVNPLDTIAYPYGAYNQDVKNASASNGMIAGRSVDRGYNLKNTDRFALKIQYVTASSTTNADFQNNIKPWIDTAVADKTWLVLLFHQIETPGILGQTHDPEATTPEVLQAVVDYLKQNNIKVVTLHTGVCMMTGMAGTSNCSAVVPPPATTTAATVTLTNLAQTYDGTPKSASANTEPANLSVAFTYDGVATAPTNVGSYAVLGTIQNAQYTGTATGTLVIAKGNQTISFAPVGTHTLGDTDFTVTASSTSGLSVTFATDAAASSTCSISGVTIHLLTTGTCTIIGSQAGNGNYNSAPDASVSFTINPVGQPATTVPVLTIIGSNPATVNLGGTYLDPGATASDAEDGDLTSHIVASSTVNTAVLGTYAVTYTVTDSSGLSATASRAVVVSEGASAPPTTGRITFCLVLADANNVIATTSAELPAGTFSIRLASSTMINSSIVGSKAWDTLTFKPNVNLIVNGRTPDAQCRTIHQLPFGTYYYSELSKPDSAIWKTPKYNDEDTQPVNNVFDFFPYSPALFTATTSDDATRTLGSDGQITLDREHRDESVMIFQMFDKNAIIVPPVTDTGTLTPNTGGQGTGGGEATTTPETATTTPPTSGGTGGGGNTDGGSSFGGWAVVIGNGPPIASGRFPTISNIPSINVTLPSGVVYEIPSSSSSIPRYISHRILEANKIIASSSPVRLLINTGGNPLIDQVAGAAGAGKSLSKMFWYSTFFLLAILGILGAWFDRRRRMALQ